MAEKLRGRIQGRTLDSGHIEGVGTFIYSTSTHRYLFLLRNTSKYSGTWGLAGGKIDANEHILESLTRELKEELGYDFLNVKVIPIEKFTSDNGNFTYHTFVVPVKSEFVPKLNAEHRGYCWVKLDDHPKPLHPGLWRNFNFNTVKQKIKTLETILN